MINMKSYKYPEKITETFDKANFHIKYCLSFVKKHINGEVLEVGAGCGSFTRHYLDNKVSKLLLTETDKKNILNLSKKFKDNQKIKVQNKHIYEIKKNFDTIIYFHVLEHIKDHRNELKEAMKRLNKNGKLIILVPAHQKMYSNLDKVVGHYRRYEKKFFFSEIFKRLSKIEFKYLDSSGYFLYFLNKLFFKNEDCPSKLKIFIWDKLFTPFSIILDFIFRYKVGKCILTIYKRN